MYVQGSYASQRELKYLLARNYITQHHAKRVETSPVPTDYRGIPGCQTCCNDILLLRPYQVLIALNTFLPQVVSSSS